MGILVPLKEKEGFQDVASFLHVAYLKRAQNIEGFKDQEVQSVQNSGASTNKLAEKPRRSKGMEKSVLDDIMGDPDDFGDLGDLDAGSESDGGRWEDTLKTE